MTLGAETRVKLAQACRIIANAGLAEDILGHVSLRTDDGIAIRCRGPRESGLLFTVADDIHEVITGVPLPGGYQAPNELLLHAEVMRIRPDAQSVVHAHATSAVAADLAGIALAPIVGAYNIPAMRMAARSIPVYPRSLLINTDRLGHDVASALGDAPALILRGHGIITVGRTIEEAVVRAINIEILARMHVLASVNGDISYRISDEDFAATPDLGSTFNDGYVWQHHLARLAHAGLALT
ncbi:class II aldolase/adducin family protein [Microbacterium sp. SYP-A9085]|uniref:class II aldolase/adducin family protein n=1 Tax=Microbacterium sp. SYP-A9085 TaxID=2664454 RepID=UPI0013256415|nr:class II aldolase/adducin family protein [Microbacterium sp. SYP-A9085]